MARGNQQVGFSLIELIVVIVLLGIMSAGAGMLITGPIESYRDQSRRQQLVDLAEISLRKIANDIRAALPNSIRVVDSGPGSWALEMINTVDGARYRDEFGGGFVAEDDILRFTAADTRFNVLGQFGNLTGVDLSNLRAVIYNTNPTDLYTDAVTTDNTGIISYPAGIAVSPNLGEDQVTLTPGFQFQFQSPSQRLFLVDGPITYTCNTVTGLLMRFDGYAYLASQSSTPGGNSGRITSNVSSCNINYDAGTAQRGGLITIDLALTDEGESVRLLHQVHVDNVP